jgi:hypothetical protein
MTLLADIIRTYNHWLTLGDPRVQHWPFMGDPMPTFYIFCTYLLIVTIGPLILKGRSFEVRKAVLGYNLFIVLLNVYIAYELYSNTIGHYYWPCQPVDTTVNEQSMRIASAVWLFYFSKFIELLDSIFFMLRGKYNQLSFLHIYHHSTMTLMFWLGANYAPGGNTVFGCGLNSSIHVIMYGYYFVSALGPQYRKYLGWKKYLTLIQERNLTNLSTKLSLLMSGDLMKNIETQHKISYSLLTCSGIHQYIL